MKLMGVSASRIWKEICALQSNDVRAQMIQTVLSSPIYVEEAKRTGVYDPVMEWLLSYQQGYNYTFPYFSGRIEDVIVHEEAQWHSYTPSVQKTERYSARPQALSNGKNQRGNNTSGYASNGYAPNGSAALVVSQSAKAHDYFQESLTLLGLDETEVLTYDRIKSAYRRAALQAHPDKGGSEQQFDEIRRAFQYIEKILQRISPTFQKTVPQGPITMENASLYRGESDNVVAPPVQISAKKMDMSTFNRLFEENRLPDPSRDTGYGDWLKGQGGSEDIEKDPRLRGKFNQQVFESVFREKAQTQRDKTAIIKHRIPDAIISSGGTELGGDDTENYTAAIGSDTTFTDLKEAYSYGATVFQEVADINVQEKKLGTLSDAKRQREADLLKIDPDEQTRIAIAAKALEERERKRRLRLAMADTHAETWSESMRNRLMVTDT
jgi:curved DNA-binding protein CbpA